MIAVEQPQGLDPWAGANASRESGAVLAVLRDRAQRILAEGPYEASDPITRALEIVAELEPGALVMARKAHELIRDGISGILQSCGYVEEDLVPLVNGLKQFAEEGPWAYQEGGWQSLTPRPAR